MIKRLVRWLIKKLTHGNQKTIIIAVLQDIVNSKTSSIDNKTAEIIISLAVKSAGNKVTSFTIKD